jgi:hypothetical protein
LDFPGIEGWKDSRRTKNLRALGAKSARVFRDIRVGDAVKYSSEWPFGCRYNADEHVTVVFNRRHEGVCRLKGRHPRWDLKSAEPCDRLPRQYGAGNTYFHRDDANSARTCPITRQRLRKLLQDIPVLREQVARRQVEKDAAQSAQQLSHNALVQKVFGEPLTGN